MVKGRPDHNRKSEGRVERERQRVPSSGLFRLRGRPKGQETGWMNV